MASLSFDAPTPTVGLPAAWALRIRVRRSAIGSVMLIVRASPTRLRQAWDFAAVGGLTQLGACQSQRAVHAGRSAVDRAAIAVPRRPRAARLPLQFRLRRLAPFPSGLRVADQLF